MEISGSHGYADAAQFDRAHVLPTFHRHRPTRAIESRRTVYLPEGSRACAGALPSVVPGKRPGPMGMKGGTPP